jgi:hypothetical protein
MGTALDHGLVVRAVSTILPVRIGHAADEATRRGPNTFRTTP